MEERESDPHSQHNLLDYDAGRPMNTPDTTQGGHRQQPPRPSDEVSSISSISDRRSHSPSSIGPLNTDVAWRAASTQQSKRTADISFHHDAIIEQHPKPSNPSAPSKWYKRKLQEDGWLWEATGAIISVVAMIAIIAILPQIHGKPLLSWKFVLAPATLISAFITIAKTAMMLPITECISQLKWIHFWQRQRALVQLEVFDSASRGPWGAFTSLFSVGARSPMTATGSLLTILALAMGPFAQQVIHFETRYVPTPSQKAHIPAARAYDSGSSPHGQNVVAGTYMDPQGSKYGFFDAFFSDPGMQGALLNGIFGNVDPISPVCPSGNCTWESFSTLGVCSACTNITASVSQGKCDGIGSKKRLDTWKTEDGLHVEAQQLCDGGECIQGNQNLPCAGAYGTHTIINSTAKTGAPDQNPSDVGNPDAFSIPPGIDLLTEVLLFRKAGMTISISPTLGGWLDNSGDPETYVCRLKWCMRTWSDVKVTNGSLSYKTHNSPLSGVEYTNGSYMFTSNVTERPWTSSSFQITSLDLISVSKFVNRMFQFSLSSDASTSSQPGVLNPSRQLLGVANISRTFQSIADSLTLQIGKGKNTIAVPGTVLQPATYVVVQWEWLILPGVLVLLSVVFLAVTLIVNRHKGAPVWKSGLLPLLFHGVVGFDREDLAAEDRSAIDKIAREMKVRLQRDEKDVTYFMKD